eukprot:5594535-Pyramimonas_sp.AAC.1
MSVVSIHVSSVGDSPAAGGAEGVAENGGKEAEVRPRRRRGRAGHVAGNPDVRKKSVCTPKCGSLMSTRIRLYMFTCVYPRVSWARVLRRGAGSSPGDPRDPSCSA